MCGRYKRRSDKQKIAEAFHVGGEIGGFEIPLDDDIAPSTQQPFIRENKDTGLRDLAIGRWGFIPSWQKADAPLPFKTFNARSEDIETSKMWSRAFTHHRCLVPIDSFYEWHRIRKRNNPKYEIGLKKEGPFALAGLWGAWKEPASESWLQSFAVLTTESNELMAKIHDRMPLILHSRDFDRWLSREMNQRLPLDLLRPYDADEMYMHLVSNEQPELLPEVNSR